MRHMLGYTVWNKIDMLTWLLEGIVNNFDPAQTEIAFHFDACEDQSQVVFDSLVPYWLHVRGKWKLEHVHKIVSETEVRELGGHNKLLDAFLASNCDFLLVAQDDQHWNASPVEHLERLAGHYGERLGLIGGRDGYTAGYGSFTGSFWSESAVQRRLQPGEWVELPYQNSGPNIYNRHLVEKVGKLDDQFVAHYVWDDYGARALKEGFVNGILGMNVTHAKFGRVKAMSHHWLTTSGADRARLTTKHGI